MADTAHATAPQPGAPFGLSREGKPRRYPPTAERLPFGRPPPGCTCPDYSCPVHAEAIDAYLAEWNPSREPPPAPEGGPVDADQILSGVARKRGRKRSGRKPHRDTPPKAAAAAAGAGQAAPAGPSTSELEATLAQLLTLPAIPARAVWHCEFCMMHFIQTGPVAAAELAKLSEQNPALRGLLVRIHAVMGAITWGGVLGMYLGKPILHHLAPEPMLAAVGPVMGVPPRPAPAAAANGQPGPQQSRPLTFAEQLAAQRAQAEQLAAQRAEADRLAQQRAFAEQHHHDGPGESNAPATEAAHEPVTGPVGTAAAEAAPEPGLDPLA